MVVSCEPLAFSFAFNPVKSCKSFQIAFALLLLLSAFYLLLSAVQIFAFVFPKA